MLHFHFLLIASNCDPTPGIRISGEILLEELPEHRSHSSTMPIASSPPPVVSNPLSVPPYQRRRAPAVNWSSHPAHQPAMAAPRIPVHPLPIESPAPHQEQMASLEDENLTYKVCNL